MDPTAGMLVNIAKGIFDQASRMGGNLMDIGMIILGSLAAIQLAWVFIYGMLEDDMSEMVTKLVSFGIYLAIVLFIFQYYSVIANAVVTGSKEIASAAIKSGTSDPFNVAINHFVKAAKAIQQLGVPPPNEDWYVSLGRFFSTGFIASMIGALASGVSFIALALYMFIFMLGDIMMAIGVVAGPLLIGASILAPVNFLMSSWLSFMMGAMMYKVVATIMVSLLSAVISQLPSLLLKTAQTTGGVAGTDIKVAFMALVISLIVCFLLWQVPNIAVGLIGGSAGASARFGLPGRGTGFGSTGSKGGRSQAGSMAGRALQSTGAAAGSAMRKMNSGGRSAASSTSRPGPSPVAGGGAPSTPGGGRTPSTPGGGRTPSSSSYIRNKLSLARAATRSSRG